MALNIAWKVMTTSAGATVLSSGSGFGPSEVLVRCAAGTVYLGHATTVTSSGCLTLSTAVTGAAAVRLPAIGPNDTLYAMPSSSSVTIEVYVVSTT
jgi:hypothetical protein